MRRFTSKTVFLGFIVTWFLAASPTSHSPIPPPSSATNATYDGVMRFPWSLAMMSTLPFLYTPTHEYVVPRSIPMMGPPTPSLLLLSVPSSVVGLAFGELPAAARGSANSNTPRRTAVTIQAVLAFVRLFRLLSRRCRLRLMAALFMVMFRSSPM